MRRPNGGLVAPSPAGHTTRMDRSDDKSAPGTSEAQAAAGTPEETSLGRLLYQRKGNLFIACGALATGLLTGVLGTAALFAQNRDPIVPAVLLFFAVMLSFNAWGVRSCSISCHERGIVERSGFRKKQLLY